MRLGLRELAFALSTLVGATLGLVLTLPVFAGALFGGVFGFLIGGVIAGALRLDSAGGLGTAPDSQIPKDEPVFTASPLRRAFFRSVLLALAVALAVALVIAIGTGARADPLELLLWSAGGLPFGFWLGTTSLLELMAARRFAASLRRDLGAAAVTAVAAFLACFFASFQLVYIVALVQTHSVEAALDQVTHVATTFLREGYVVPAAFAAYGVPVGVVAFVRLRGFRLRWQVPIALGASLVLSAPQTLYLCFEAQHFWEPTVAIINLAIVLAGALFLPLVAWLADAVERRFVVWTARES